jgi:hypothetical protein
MMTRIKFLGSAFLVAVLLACGGGGGGATLIDVAADSLIEQITGASASTSVIAM